MGRGARGEPNSASRTWGEVAGRFERGFGLGSRRGKEMVGESGGGDGNDAIGRGVAVAFVDGTVDDV